MATWANTTLCTVSEVEAYFRDLHFLLATEANAETAQQVQAKINLVKSDVIRPEVLLLAQRAFPSTTDNLLRLARTRYQQYINHTNEANRLAGTDSLTGSSVDEIEYDRFFNSNLGALKPRVWYSAGVPTSTTNTSAANGDFGCDTTNWEMYINRSTTTTPDWDLWRTEDAHDYIYNPTELKRWACLETAALCLNDRAFRNFLTNSVDPLAIKDMQESLMEQIHGSKYVEGAKAVALKMLRFDISGNSSLSNYENTATGGPFLGFA